MRNRRYNNHLKRFIELKDGEEFCKKCHGKGSVFRYRPYRKKIALTCNICLGTGKLDWVEKVVGKNKENY